MNFEINGINIFIIIAVTFLVSALTTPIAKKIAAHVNAMDMPNKRKVHKIPIPRLGGLAIFASFLFGYICFADGSVQMLSILIGGFILLLTGFIDDIKPVKVKYKLIMQILAALVVVFYGSITLNYISAFGLTITFPVPLNYIVTVLFILAITNAINLLDGLDGLAAGVSSIYFLTIGIIAFLMGRTSNLDVILSFIMLGATLGFLVHNFYPATVFMGDSGSLFLGFIISVIALLGFKATTLTSLIVPIVILSIPILDTILAIFRRILNHKPISAPDKNHIHHQLLKMKFSTRTTVLIIYLINIIFAFVSICYVHGNNEIAIFLYILLMIGLLYIVINTDILYDHSKKKK